MMRQLFQRESILTFLATAAAILASFCFVWYPDSIVAAVAIALIPWIFSSRSSFFPGRLCRWIDHHKIIRHFPLAGICLLAWWECSVLLEQSILLHESFRTQSFDLGNYLSALWRFTQGDSFALPLLDDRNWLGDHFAIGLAIVAPLLLLFPTAEALLAAQTVAVIGASAPLYLLVRKISASFVLAGLVAAIYLLHPATQLPLLYDFHDAKFIPCALFLFLYCLRLRWLVSTLLSALLLLSFRELMAPVVCGIGAVAMRSQRLCGSLLVVLGIIYFITVKVIVMPVLLNGEVSQDFYYSNLRADHESFFAGVLRTLITSPQYVVYDSTTIKKFEYLALTIGVFGFLPLVRSKSLFILAAPLFCTVLSGWRATYSIAYQYTYLIFPVALWLAVEIASEQFKNSAQRMCIFFSGVLIATIACNIVYGTFPERQKLHGLARGDVELSTLRQESRWYAPLRAALSVIPRADSVEASDALIPHLAARSSIFRGDTSRRKPDWIVRWRSEDHSVMNTNPDYQNVIQNEWITMSKRRGNRETVQ